MVGFNVPTFKLLDALSAEVEYFKSPFPNDVGALTNYGLPIPGPVNATGATNYWGNGEYQNDHWKWSVHASKTIATNYTIMAQIASDHLRSLAVNDQNVDFEEIFHNTNQWYYMLKMHRRVLIQRKHEHESYAGNKLAITSMPTLVR
jgi:hypothetical protein